MADRKRNPDKWRRYYKKAYESNPERNKAYAKRRRAKNPELARLKWLEWRDNNRSYDKARSKKWKAENKDHVVKYQAAFRRKNRERRNEALRKWIAANPIAARAYYNNRRAKMRAGGTHTPSELKDILRLQHWKCALCRSPLKRQKRHLDHINALANGGSNVRSNIQFLCVSCNTSKHDKDQMDFMRSRGFLL